MEIVVCVEGGPTDVEGVMPGPVREDVPAPTCVIGDCGGAKPGELPKDSRSAWGVTGWGRPDG